VCGSEVSVGWLDAGTNARTRMPDRAPHGGKGLSAEEQELLLDIAQMALDLAGIVDPTPVSDGTSMVISLGRGDLAGAGISAIAMVPLLGDLAKAGNLGRWAETVSRAVSAARRNARLAQRMRPTLKAIADLVDLLPRHALPPAARAAVDRISRELHDLLGVLPRATRTKVLNDAKRAWSLYVRRLPLKAPAMHQGVLWSKLDGAEHAATLARADGKVSLEMTLAAFDFEKAYRATAKHLAEVLGESEGFVWEQFGRDVWREVSERYARGLSGRVTAYVRFGGTKGLDSGADAILFDELETIAEWMRVNPNISAVELVDTFGTKIRIMDRASVVRAGRLAN
jgi:hypothetical protein